MHGSIINLIIDEETLPAWNPYHMGGEQLATPPGFHFFVTVLILFTGMDLISAQLITAIFFSSIVVFPSFLISKKIWNNKNAGILAAFFAAISALSIEMLSWGGYTNIISLFLTSIIMYIFLIDLKKSKFRNLLMGTLLFGTLILTHTFSLSIILPILTFYFISLIIGKIRKIKVIKISKMLRFFIITGALGILIVAPWLLRVFNFYIGASSEGVITGGLDNRNLILANRTVEPIILILIIVLIPTLIMLKESRKKFVDNSSLLLISWFFVPLVLTQAYIFGIFTDYSRFMYFIDFPGIIIISAGLLYIFRYITITINRINKHKCHKIKKLLPIIASILTIFVFINCSLWSIFPDEGLKRVEFYSTIKEPEDLTLNWIKTYTAKDSILVADHLYGWWLSGIAERTTLSGAGLEFLIYSHELEVAKNAQLLLDTNYYIDNGLIQIRDDGPYLSRNSPLISIEKWTGESLPIFQFNDTILEHKEGKSSLSSMVITENSIEQNQNFTRISTRYINELFTIKKMLYLEKEKNYIEILYEIESINSQNNDFNVSFGLLTTGTKNIENITNKVKNIFINYSNYNFSGELNFIDPKPVSRDVNATNYTEIIFQAKDKINIEMLAGVKESVGYPKEIETWNYEEIIRQYNVSHVVCRDPSVFMKFANDPNFRLLFNSEKIALFNVIE